MDETLADPENEVEYDGHVLRVDNYVDPESSGSIPTFAVSCGTAYVHCKEGLVFQNGAGESVVEPDTLDVAFLSSGGQKGIGTLLMRFALEEGIRRGFHRARADIFNPKVVSIIEKLKAEALVKSAVYFHRPSRTRDLSTEELFDSGSAINAEAAKEILGKIEADEDGYQDETAVDCALEL